MVLGPLEQRFEAFVEFRTVLGDVVLDAGRNLVVALAGEETGGSQVLEARRQRGTAHVVEERVGEFAVADGAEMGDGADHLHRVLPAEQVDDAVELAVTVLEFGVGSGSVGHGFGSSQLVRCFGLDSTSTFVFEVSCMPENAAERDAVQRENQTNDHWLGGGSVLEAPLPDTFRETMSGFFGGGKPVTLGEWVEEIRSLAGGGVDVEQLCHAGEETPHRAERGGETTYFQCFYDAVALAHIVDGAVDIRTESPTGEEVRARATGDGIETTPANAVVSFGVAAGAGSASDEPTIGEVYDAVCPFVRAFPSREEYEKWAEDVDAETVGLPLAAGVPVAAALVE